MSSSSENVGPVDTSYCGDKLLGVSIAIAAVQIIVVPARFYTRYIQRIKCTLDDYLILPALIASLGQSALYIVLLKVAGLGCHFEYGLLANQTLDFPFTVTPAKLSILLFYLRIFQTRSFRIFSYTIGFLVLSHGTGVFFASFFQCSPQAFYRYLSPPNIFTDLIILVMPMPVVWKLQTRITQKLTITGVFLLGGLGLVTRTSVNLGIWTMLEGGIIIIAACLPPIWPLIVRFLPNRLMTKHRNTAGDAQGRLYTGTSQLKPKPRDRERGRFSRLAEEATGGRQRNRMRDDGEESTHSQARVMRDSISIKSLDAGGKASEKFGGADSSL
ncbi:hypothetical protein BDW72DRAFT_208160 [Aspergillus terricola var. indicus]